MESSAWATETSCKKQSRDANLAFRRLSDEEQVETLRREIHALRTQLSEAHKRRRVKAGNMQQPVVVAPPSLLGIGALRRSIWMGLYTSWAEPLLVSFLDDRVTIEVRRACAPLKIPVALVAWVLTELVSHLERSVHPHHRADGGAIALAMLKSLGDAMMKKVDVTDAKRPGAQQTRDARVEVTGKRGAAKATLGSGLDTARAVGDVVPQLPLEQAIHSVAIALDALGSEDLAPRTRLPPPARWIRFRRGRSPFGTLCLLVRCNDSRNDNATPLAPRQVQVCSEGHSQNGS